VYGRIAEAQILARETVTATSGTVVMVYGEVSPGTSRRVRLPPDAAYTALRDFGQSTTKAGRHAAGADERTWLKTGVEILRAAAG